MLQLQHISFAFSHEKAILQDVSLTLEAGKIYALMGSNGAGKTTLFNLITGFIRPQSGEIYLTPGPFPLRESGGSLLSRPPSEGAGRRLTHLSPYQINRGGIGRTFQDLRLIMNLTVKENIILAMRYNPTDHWLRAMLPPKFNCSANLHLEQKADEIIERFLLDDVRLSPAGETSYGQQKLLTLACCVANAADFLLLDEAVAGVQPVYRERIAALIKGLKEEGKTILVIEHNTDFIADIADEIFFLHEGRLARFGNMDLLRADKTVMEAYL